MGAVTRGVFGGGFHTNQDSLSLGIVVGINELMSSESGQLYRFIGRP